MPSSVLGLAAQNDDEVNLVYLLDLASGLESRLGDVHIVLSDFRQVTTLHSHNWSCSQVKTKLLECW